MGPDLGALLHISTGTGVPIYLQIVNQVKLLVASGQLATGQELPPIRKLALDKHVNPNTIARAYRELELAGVVIKRGTIGTYVLDVGSRLEREERNKILTEKIDALLAEAKQMRTGFEELIQLIRQRDKVMQSPPQET